jgi:hypothetical protein
MAKVRDASLGDDNLSKISIAAVSLLAAGALAAGPAQASSVTLAFPSSGSATPTGFLNGGGGGQFFNTGDFVTETFAATGLGSATSAHWTFTMSDYTASGVTSTFDALINGVTVGSYSFTSNCDICGTTESIDFSDSFAAIAGDTYTLRIEATSTVFPGGGSWNWNPDGQVTLSGGAGSVPEPAAWALMVLGFGGLGAAMRSRRRIAAPTAA